MKHITLFLGILAIAACTANDIKLDEATGDIFVAKNNFLEFPSYKETDEIDLVPKNGKCSSDNCNELTVSGKVYYKALLMNENNYANYLVGLWSGGDCVSDQWSMDAEGNFSSHYPLEGRSYKWSGKYFFKGAIYIEDGVDSEGGKEWNEANLYYVPANGLLIYKGIRSFDSFNKDGSIKYIYYKGPDFYYFRRCDRV